MDKINSCWYVHVPNVYSFVFSHQQKSSYYDVNLHWVFGIGSLFQQLLDLLYCYGQLRWFSVLRVCIVCTLHIMETFLASVCRLSLPSPPLDSIQVMAIVWWLRGNIIRTALCWIVWHNVHSLQHTYMSSSYRSNRLSHWDPHAVHRGSCLELYYCNMVEWFWWDSSLILTTNWFPSVL